MKAEELFNRCVQRKDGHIIATKLAKLYVIVHFKHNHNHNTYIAQETDSIFHELAHHFVTYIEADLTKTAGRHAAILSALFLSDDLDII